MISNQPSGYPITTDNVDGAYVQGFFVFEASTLRPLRNCVTGARLDTVHFQGTGYDGESIWPLRSEVQGA